MNTHQVPSIETHIPKTEAVPDEPAELAVGRPDAPTPSLWQRSVKVRHKATGRPALVHKVDWGMNMFRAFFPEEGDVDPESGKPAGRFSERTEWEHCANWDVEVTFSPAEIERQAAKTRLSEAISKLEGRSLALATVLCDDPDPGKALGKLELLISTGVIQGPVDALAAAAAEARLPAKEPVKAKRRTEPTEP